jgi:HK97 family phage portal protein
MIHLRWFTPPQSLVGVSPLIQSRQIVGLGLAMDRFLAQFYGDGATPSSVLESEKDLTTEQARTLVATWDSAHRKHRKPAVLSGGLKWRSVTVSASDQQMVEMREQVVRDVARVYGIPSHLVGAMGDSQTYQNVEQASLNFLMHTVTPWLRRIEIGLSRILPPGVDVTFDTAAMLRTDALTRARVGQIQAMTGTRSPNELRTLDGMEPYDGGDVFHQSMPGKATSEAVPLGEDADTAAPVMGVLGG